MELLGQKRKCEVREMSQVNNESDAVAAKRKKRAAYARTYYIANKEKMSAYAAANKEKIAARQKIYRAATHREKKAAWVKEHREEYVSYNALRRARKLGNSIGLPKPDYKAILTEFGMICHLCGLKIESKTELEFDHVIPLSKGGPHSSGNVRPSHERCNRKKGSKLLDQTSTN
jgi:5-methylcytosine-specific restriction endonuclease McrA